jgi:hypothetical protein
MARLSRAEMRELAADREQCAARSDAAAQAAERDANDKTLPFAHRREAAAQAPISRRHAREYREDAAKLREGYLPGEDW